MASYERIRVNGRVDVMDKVSPIGGLDREENTVDVWLVGMECYRESRAGMEVEDLDIGRSSTGGECKVVVIMNGMEFGYCEYCHGADYHDGSDQYCQELTLQRPS